MSKARPSAHPEFKCSACDAERTDARRVNGTVMSEDRCRACGSAAPIAGLVEVGRMNTMTHQAWKERRLDEALNGDATAVAAEGARVGFITCKLCGAAVLLDPRDNGVYDALQLHRDWHRGLGA